MVLTVLKAKLKVFWELLVETADEYVEDHVAKFSASLAYYTIFSIGPLLLVIIHLLGLFYKQNASHEVFMQLSQFIGPSSAEQLESLLNNMNTSNSSRLFNIIGIAVFVYSATSIFTEIQSSINYMWSIKSKPNRGWLKMLTNRALSFVLIISAGLLLIASLVLNVIVDMITGQLNQFQYLQQHLQQIDVGFIALLNTAVLYVIVTFLFFIIFMVLPDGKIHWKDNLVGASFTGVLFLIGKFLITWYLTSSKLITAYGAAASVIILLSWIYYSAMILYFGAEFTDVYARKCGRGVSVKKTAVFVIKRESKELPAMKTHHEEHLK